MWWLIACATAEWLGWQRERLALKVSRKHQPHYFRTLLHLGCFWCLLYFIVRGPHDAPLGNLQACMLGFLYCMKRLTRVSSCFVERKQRCHIAADDAIALW
jgi:hypothetical protein